MPSETCPSCGGAIRLIIGETGDYPVPALTGAQVDAAERMAYAIVEMTMAATPAQYQYESEAAYRAAQDFYNAGNMASGPRQAPAQDNYTARVRAWLDRFRGPE